MNQRHMLTLGLTVLALFSPLCGYASTSSPPTEIRSFLDQVWLTNPSIQSAEAEVNAATANASALGRPL